MSVDVDYDDDDVEEKLMRWSVDWNTKKWKTHLMVRKKQVLISLKIKVKDDNYDDDH